MRFLALFLTFGLLAFILLLNGGCSDPPHRPIAYPLAGDYEGVYSVTHNLGDTAHQYTAWNYVFWTFDDDQFHLRIDSDRHTGHCFCAVTGQYVLQEGIVLHAVTTEVDAEAGCGECDESEAPSGLFVRETKGDSLILHRQADSMFMELRLIRYN